MLRRDALRAALKGEPAPAAGGTAGAEAHALASAAVAAEKRSPAPAWQALPALAPGGTLPCAAPGVLRAVEPGAGRGLRTAVPRCAGDVVLAEPPYAAVVHKAARSLRCHHCFARLPPDAHPCGGCAAARYCAAACESAAASGPHAAECGGAPWPAALPADAVLAARMAVRAAREAAPTTAADATSPEAAGGARAAAALATMWDELPADERTERVLMAAVLHRCLQESARQGGIKSDFAAVVVPDVAALLRSLLALRCNAFAVTDDWAPACWTGATRDQARALLFCLLFFGGSRFSHLSAA